MVTYRGYFAVTRLHSM